MYSWFANVAKQVQLLLPQNSHLLSLTDWLKVIRVLYGYLMAISWENVYSATQVPYQL